MNTNVISKQKGTVLSTKQMVLVSLLAALSYVLMLIHLPYKHLGFLEIEFSDIPAVFAALQFGPFAGVFVELIKNIIKAITASTTSGIGELANFIISIAYIIPVGILYKVRKARQIKHGNSKSWSGIFMIFLFFVGTAAMVITGALLNYFVMIPLYARLFGGMDVVVGIAAAGVPAIKNLGSLVLLGITPFNIAKGIGISIIGYYAFRILNGKMSNLLR